MRSLFSLGAMNKAMLEALGRSQAVIEFKPDGTILSANDLFLKTVGYSLEEISGRHHSMFVRDEDRDTPEYRAFWSALAAGTFQQKEFRRVTRDGREIWLQASYNPILDRSGRVARVVKFATDITAEKMKSIDLAGQVEAHQPVAGGHHLFNGRHDPRREREFPPRRRILA